MITYTNNAKTVTDALFALIGTEFAPYPVIYEPVFDGKYLSTMGRYIRIWLESTDQLDLVAIAENRVYNFEIVFYWDWTKKEIKETHDNLASPDMERLQRLLFNNSSYMPSDAYKWHYLEIDCDAILQPIQQIDDLPEPVRGYGSRANISIYRTNVGE